MGGGSDPLWPPSDHPVVHELLGLLSRDGRTRALVFTEPLVAVAAQIRAVREESEVRRLAVDLVDLAYLLDTRLGSKSAAREVLGLAVLVAPQLRVLVSTSVDWTAARRITGELDPPARDGTRDGLKSKPRGFGVGLRRR